MNERKFTGSGLFAIEPSAFGLVFPIGNQIGYEKSEACSIITVHGPLSHAGWFFSSYESVKEEVRKAAVEAPETIILRISSPGGDVAGAFDAAREIRRIARESGKTLVAFTDSKLCSSAYALASAADLIYCSSTAEVGSIGVIATAVETVKADEAMGVKYTIVTSGDRKADGNPHLEISEGALEAMQQSVDRIATVFFDLVAEHRGMSVEKVASLEAATFVGSEAESRGLVDKVASWEDLLRSLSEGEISRKVSSESNLKVSSMPHDEDDKKESKSEDSDEKKDDSKEDARAALKRAANSGDEKVARRARRALKAYDAEDEDEDKKESKAEEDDEKEKEATAAPTAVAAESAEIDLAAQVQGLSRELAALKEERASRERADFFASRPDLAPELVKSLANLPLDRVKKIVESIPKTAAVASKVADPAAEASRGADSYSPEVRPNRALDLQMGLVGHTQKAAFDPSKQSMSFGFTPEVK